jgi:hypothetical protein
MLDSSLLDAHDYALIDQLAVANIPNDLPVLPLVPSELKKEAHLLPLLLPLYELNEDTRSTLIENEARAIAIGQPPLISTLLASPADPKKLSIHLTERLVIRLSLRIKALLRYYDPRVFAQLQWILPKPQLCSLFGPIENWSIYLDGAWQRIDAPVVGAAIWSTDATMSARLERIGMINQALARLPSPRNGTRAQLGEQIDRFLVHARDCYQLNHDEDMVSFAVHALNVNPNFDQHPIIKSLIGRLAQEQQTYSDATALLDESVWQSIGNDLTIHKGISS